MYESAFGLKEPPFALPPDTDYFLMLPQHQKAYNLLMHGIRNTEGFSLLTGEIGCGKTMLIRQLMNDIGPDHTIGLITNTTQLENQTLARVMLSLGQQTEGLNDTLLQKRFTDFLVNEYSANRQVVIIVDEAQNLSDESLEELRVLSNINNGKYHLLHIVLAGQPELRKTLASPSHEQLSQRISKVFHLLPLTEEDTLKYIYHRMHVAGATRGVFTKEACQLIHNSSRGVPRVINQLCDMSLIYAFGLQRETVTLAVVRLVLKERLEAWTASPFDREKTAPSTEDSASLATLEKAPESMNSDSAAQSESSAGTPNIIPNLPSQANQSTIIQGVKLLSADVRFRERFGLPHNGALGEFEWLNIVDEADRDRVQKVFSYYVGLGSHNFDFSATVRNRWKQEKEARLTFRELTDGPAKRFLLETDFYDHALSIH